MVGSELGAAVGNELGGAVAMKESEGEHGAPQPRQAKGREEHREALRAMHAKGARRLGEDLPRKEARRVARSVRENEGARRVRDRIEDHRSRLPRRGAMAGFDYALVAQRTSWR